MEEASSCTKQENSFDKPTGHPQMFSESESEDDGGKLLMLSGEGGDFSYCFGGEESMQRTGGPGGASFENLIQALETADQKGLSKIVFDYDFLVQNKVPDDLDSFCDEFGECIKNI